MKPFRVVPKQVALNPVAQSVARDRLLSECRTFRLALYGLPDGAHIPSQCIVAAELLAVAVRLSESRERTGENAVLAGALSALAQCSERGFRWRTRDAVAVDVALERAVEVVRLAKPAELRDAWAFVRTMSA